MVKKSLTDLLGDEPNKALPDSITEKDGKYEIDINFLRQANIFFATPCYSGLITDQYFLSMFRATQHLMKLGIDFRITTIRNESLVTRARNILTAMFLESPCTHLFFIDADIEFDPESVIRAIGLDKEIIAGAYPKKTLPIQYAINLKVLDPSTGKINVDRGAVEVIDASTGFFCIKREVIEKMTVEYPHLHYKNDASLDPKFNKHCYAFFDTHLDEKDNRYLSEDYYFCRLAQQMGIKVWIDPSTKLNHVGSYTFEGNVAQILQGHKLS